MKASGMNVLLSHPHTATLTRHPEVAGAKRRPSKDDRPGPSPFEALASLGHLRVTGTGLSVHHQTDPHAVPCARAVRACSSRSTASSFAAGFGVSVSVAAKRTGQPVCALISSCVTPGWIEVTVISFVTG